MKDPTGVDSRNKNLSKPIQQALALERLQKDAGIADRRELARLLGCSVTYVHRLQKFNDAPGELQEFAREGVISFKLVVDHVLQHGPAGALGVLSPFLDEALAKNGKVTESVVYGRKTGRRRACYDLVRKVEELLYAVKDLESTRNDGPIPVSRKHLVELKKALMEVREQAV